MKLKTTLDNGLVVSTVDLPFRHVGGLFETMVFPNDFDFGELDMKRYEFAADAQRGHKSMCEFWSKARHCRVCGGAEFSETKGGPCEVCDGSGWEHP